MNMRLLGARTIDEVVPEMLDTTSLSSHVVAVPGDALYNTNCKFLLMSHHTRYPTALAPVAKTLTDLLRGVQTRSCSTHACARPSPRYDDTSVLCLCAHVAGGCWPPRRAYL